MDNIKTQEKKYISHVFASIRGLVKPATAGDATLLRGLIPDGDAVIDEYAKVLSKYKFDTSQSLNSVLKDRVEAFQKSHIESLKAFYQKSFSHLNKVLDDLKTRSSEMRGNYEKVLIQNKKEFEALKEAKQRDLDKMIQEARNEHEARIKELRRQIENVEASSQHRVDEETKRVMEHYEKQLAVKNEAHQMATSAIDKAKKELTEATEQRKEEVQAMKEENDKVLEEHARQLNEKSRELELKVGALMKELEGLKKKQSELEPELNRQWGERKEVLTKEFEQEELKLSGIITEKTDAVKKLQQEVESLKSEMEKNRNEANERLTSKMEEMETQLISVIDERKPTVEREHQDLVIKLNAKLTSLQENLETMKRDLQKDKDDFDEKMKDKSRRREEREKWMAQQRSDELAAIQADIDDVNREIEETKREWEIQAKEIEEAYKRDMDDLAMKEKNDDKYFRAKLEALQRELERVMKENEEMAASIPEYEENKRILAETEQNFRESEKLFTRTLTEEMEAKIEEKVNARVRELREKHRMEREKLLETAATLEQKEVALREQISQESLKLESTGGDPVRTALLASNAYIDASFEKWRRDYFVETKNLKKEEAEALKRLDTCKLEFKAAIEKTIALREQLKTAAQKYDEQIEAAKTKGAQEVEDLQALVEAKEKEVIQLERQYEANEREVRQRVRQIESAEERLQQLRQKLADEKAKIREMIKKEYDPLISEQNEKTDAIMVELEKLRKELQLSIENMRSDIYDVETSNAALEESLRKETEEAIARLRTELELKYRIQQEELVTRLGTEETDESEQMKLEKEQMQNDLARIRKEQEQRIEDAQREYREKIEQLNEECAKFMDDNAQKNERIQYLNSLECSTCGLLDKNIRKLEKVLVKLQLQDRDLALDGNNKKEMIKKLKGKPKLPPLASQPE